VLITVQEYGWTILKSLTAFRIPQNRVISGAPEFLSVLKKNIPFHADI
jgi:hypothetical protein